MSSDSQIKKVYVSDSPTLDDDTQYRFVSSDVEEELEGDESEIGLNRSTLMVRKQNKMQQGNNRRVSATAETNSHEEEEVYQNELVNRLKGSQLQTKVTGTDNNSNNNNRGKHGDRERVVPKLDLRASLNSNATIGRGGPGLDDSMDDDMPPVGNMKTAADTEKARSEKVEAIMQWANPPPNPFGAEDSVEPLDQQHYQQQQQKHGQQGVVEQQDGNEFQQQISQQQYEQQTRQQQLQQDIYNQQVQHDMLLQQQQQQQQQQQHQQLQQQQPQQQQKQQQQQQPQQQQQQHNQQEIYNQQVQQQIFAQQQQQQQQDAYNQMLIQQQQQDQQHQLQQQVSQEQQYQYILLSQEQQQQQQQKQQFLQQQAGQYPDQQAFYQTAQQQPQQFYNYPDSSAETLSNASGDTPSRVLFPKQPGHQRGSPQHRRTNSKDEKAKVKHLPPRPARDAPNFIEMNKGKVVEREKDGGSYRHRLYKKKEVDDMLKDYAPGMKLQRVKAASADDVQRKDFGGIGARVGGTPEDLWSLRSQDLAGDKRARNNGKVGSPNKGFNNNNPGRLLHRYPSDSNVLRPHFVPPIVDQRNGAPGSQVGHGGWVEVNPSSGHQAPIDLNLAIVGPAAAVGAGGQSLHSESPRYQQNPNGYYGNGVPANNGGQWPPYQEQRAASEPGGVISASKAQGQGQFYYPQGSGGGVYGSPRYHPGNAGGQEFPPVDGQQGQYPSYAYQQPLNVAPPPGSQHQEENVTYRTSAPGGGGPSAPGGGGLGSLPDNRQQLFHGSTEDMQRLYAVGSPRMLSDGGINKYDIVPPIADPEAVRRNGSYLRAFEQQKDKERIRMDKPTYQVYTLKDYKKLDKEIRLGGLGPTDDPETIKEKNEKRFRQLQYAKNAMDTYKINAKMQERIQRAPRELQLEEELVSGRHMAVEYSKTIPKPKPRQNANSSGMSGPSSPTYKAKQPSGFGSLGYQHAKKKTPGIVPLGPSSGISTPASISSAGTSSAGALTYMDIQKLQQRHQQEKMAVAEIQQNMQSV